MISAGCLLLTLGTLNFIEGLAAISNSHFFANNTNSIAGSLNTWGWVVLCIGVVEWAVDWRVIVKSPLSLWVGVIVLGLNAIVQLMMIPAYRFWSLSVFTLDIPRDVRPGCVWRATLERRLSMPNPAFPRSA